MAEPLKLTGPLLVDVVMVVAAPKVMPPVVAALKLTPVTVFVVMLLIEVTPVVVIVRLLTGSVFPIIGRVTAPEPATMIRS